jgi:hypothetical protein
MDFPVLSAGSRSTCLVRAELEDVGVRLGIPIEPSIDEISVETDESARSRHVVGARYGACECLLEPNGTFVWDCDWLIAGPASAAVLPVQAGGPVRID